MPDQKRKHRSDSYQYLFHEIPYDFSPAAPDYFHTDQSLYSQNTSEYIIDLEQQVYELLFSVPNFTEHQKTVIRLVKEGKGQTEIAKILNCNQSTINKTLRGNDNTRRPVKDGGIANKIVKHASLVKILPSRPSTLSNK